MPDISAMIKEITVFTFRHLTAKITPDTTIRAAKAFFIVPRRTLDIKSPPHAPPNSAGSRKGEKPSRLMLPRRAYSAAENSERGSITHIAVEKGSPPDFCSFMTFSKVTTTIKPPPAPSAPPISPPKKPPSKSGGTTLAEIVRIFIML